MTGLTLSDADLSSPHLNVQQPPVGMTPMEWAFVSPLIDEIRLLKQQKNAVVLAHNYMKPEIFHGISDITGDSLALAQKAANIDANVIVMAGVHFMAETAASEPQQDGSYSRCSGWVFPSRSHHPHDIKTLRAQWPGVPVCVYVNTSAAVKAEADICCTSGNAVQIVEWIARQSQSDRVLFLPDRYLAAWVQTQTDVTVIPFDGACEVHERYTPDDIAMIVRTMMGNLRSSLIRSALPL